MCQLHSAILSGRYLANKDWAVTIFLPKTNHDSRGKYYGSTLQQYYSQKIIPQVRIKITIQPYSHTVIYANAYAMYATIHFDASGTSTNSKAQYSFKTSDRSAGVVCALYIAHGQLYLSMGLCKPAKRVKIGQRYSSDKVTQLNKVFIRYRQILYIVIDFNVSERLQRGPEFRIITSQTTLQVLPQINLITTEKKIATGYITWLLYYGRQTSDDAPDLVEFMYLTHQILNHSGQILSCGWFLAVQGMLQELLDPPLHYKTQK